LWNSWVFCAGGLHAARYDTNGDGTLTEEEVTPLFIRFGMTRGSWWAVPSILMGKAQ
jgi:hypothetical protein